ncbi:Hypothetical predicted protein [Podarcis lilfordi]|uniref:Uncharacterized protein n=1 Tax=Podarcis lilfordi TaxID=74358 RepID=A0AA35KJD8_9SAUR|nr:Hypothetical predicted protein [Podarcis lilfordi]
MATILAKPSAVTSGILWASTEKQVPAKDDSQGSLGTEDGAEWKVYAGLGPIDEGFDRPLPSVKEGAGIPAHASAPGKIDGLRVT